MAQRLLDRQASLLEYLTSSAAIFGEPSDAPRDPTLDGIERGLLRLEARLSYDKRIEKIDAIFPMTFELLGDGIALLLRDFIDACPPISMSRLDNARQFHEFIVCRWQHEPPEPPYLRDVESLEFAYAKVRAETDENRPEAGNEDNAIERGIRRHPAAVLLTCTHDIRPIFERGRADIVPARRDVLLAIAMPRGILFPRVFEVPPVVFELLGAVASWTEPRVVGDFPEAAGLIVDLTEQGLLEVRE